jgi:hypothetical protein
MRQRASAVSVTTALLVPLAVWLGVTALPQEAMARGRHRHHKPKPAASDRTSARDERLVCDAAFEKAKEVGQSPIQLKAAAEWFGECARPTCARAMRRKCAAVQARIIAKLPSVVPVVTAASGGTVGGVQVRMDGAVLTSSLDGTSIPVDPGEHQFTFARDGEIFSTQRLTLESGQRQQIVSATWKPRRLEREEEAAGPPAPPVESKRAEKIAAEDEEEVPRPSLRLRERTPEPGDEPKASGGAPWTAYALAGVGLAGLGGAALFNLKGTASNDALIAFCKPDCKPEAVRHVRNLYLAADISLGIGLVALAGSTYLFFNHDGPAAEDNPRALPRGRISQVGVTPTPTGAVATVVGTF